MLASSSETVPRRGLRWWPAAAVIALELVCLGWIQTRPTWSFQEKNLRTLGTFLITGGLLSCWWLLFSRVPWRLRLWVAALALAFLGLCLAIFRIRGVSGDVFPILETRWSKPVRPVASVQNSPVIPSPSSLLRSDFPQFLGPNRTAKLDNPALRKDWQAHPPEVIWRQAIGPGWSGWAVAGDYALTQEQRFDQECCTCYEIFSGRVLWTHPDPAHYQNTVAGEGPRATPTIVSNQVFTLGATGILNCLDLKTGRRIWTRNLVQDAKCQVPEWGFAGSPLFHDGKIIVSAGGASGHSLLAYQASTGNLIWKGGDQPAGYSSPFLARLSDTLQILAFNTRKITSHDPGSGKVLWEYPWGNGHPHVAVPVVVDANKVLFSSGYGVGSELLETEINGQGSMRAHRIWQSRKMKAKFANLVEMGGFLYGLDDGMLACLDLKTGEQCWKEGRYGHGQALLVRDLMLLMAENGQLILLRPNPQGPYELSHYRVFDAKTWNPIALAGQLLLVRNDQEAACLKLAAEPPTPVQNPGEAAEPGPNLR